MNYDCLIFDCDGTLVDSEYLNNLATIRILHEEGLTQYDMAHAFEHFVGLRLKNIFEEIEKETGRRFGADLADRYVRMVDELTPQYLKPVPGSEELVSAAAKRMKICVASNGQRENVISSLERCGLKHYFRDDHIFTAAQVANGKPAPDIFLLAAKAMGAAPARCLVIEDSIPGTAAGFAAGMHVFGLANDHQNPVHYGERLKAAGAERIFTSLIHIRDEVFA